MKNDLYGSRWGGIIALVAVIFFFGAFYFNMLTRNVIWAVFFFMFSGINFWNARRTGKFKYWVAGGIFFLAGIVAFANTFFIENIPWKWIWTVTVVLFALVGPITEILRSVKRD